MTNGNDVTHNTKHTILFNKTKFIPYSVPPAHAPASVLLQILAHLRILPLPGEGGHAAADGTANGAGTIESPPADHGVSPSHPTADQF